MQPDPLRYYKYGESFGELNEDNSLHGRGLRIWTNGQCQIGYFEDNFWSIGNYILILPNNDFRVGENYLNDKAIRWRGTYYKWDGTEKVYGR